MKKYTFLLAVCLATAARASISYTGSLSSPEDVFQATFTLGATTTIEIETFGFGGGINAAGTVIPAGGFDPLVALFSGTGPLAAIVTDSGGNPVAGADTLSTFIGNCPPAHTVTIGTGTGSDVCGDVFLQALNLPAGTYTLLLADANYVPLAVDPGPPASTLLSDGFSDFTGGVFQTCNSTSAGTFCVTPANNFAVDLLGVSTPEPESWLLLALGLGLVAAGRSRKETKSGNN